MNDRVETWSLLAGEHLLALETELDGQFVLFT